MTKHTIHVIKPSGVRFQYTFDENLRKRAWTDTEILNALGGIKRVFGYNGTVAKPDQQLNSVSMVVDHGDPNSGFAWDNPETIVCAVDDRGNEIRRLRGPRPTQQPVTSEEQSDATPSQPSQPVPPTPTPA